MNNPGYHLGLGDGTFGPRQEVLTAAQQFRLDDLDLDGDLDLLAADLFQNSLSIRENLQSGGTP